MHNLPSLCFSVSISPKTKSPNLERKKKQRMENWSGYCQNPNLFLIVFYLTIIVILLRIVYVMHQTGRPRRPSPNHHLTTLVVLGSGGHTAEMLNLLTALQMDRFTPRFYISAATDAMSLQKARVFEESLEHHHQQETSTGNKQEGAQFMQMYRSREVGQSYITSIGTTLVAMLHALWLTFKIRPQVILCNGPGTCIPLCLAAVVFKVFGIRWSSIFYIESIARVRKLSLSGLLLYKLGMADQFFVQWPQLQKKYPRAHYVGCLM